MGPNMILELDYAFSDIEDIQLLWAHLAISAMNAGYYPREIIIAYA